MLIQGGGETLPQYRGTMKKYCNKCKAEKDLDLFYKCSSKKDNKSSNCRECADKSTKNWRLNNIDKVRKYDKGRTWAKNGRKRKLDNERNKKNRLEMSDSYMRELITKKSNLDPNDISDKLIEACRIGLQLKRALGLTPKLDKPNTN